MVDDIFPKKPEDSSLSDREWEIYCINVWCCNSLNAQEGRCRHLGLYNIANYLRRAQEVIRFLLIETGRMDDRDRLIEPINSAGVNQKEKK